MPENRCQYAQPELDYMAWHYDAELRAKRGEKQFKCPECGLYHWSTKKSRKALGQ